MCEKEGCPRVWELRSKGEICLCWVRTSIWLSGEGGWGLGASRHSVCENGLAQSWRYRRLYQTLSLRGFHLDPRNNTIHERRWHGEILNLARQAGLEIWASEAKVILGVARWKSFNSLCHAGYWIQPLACAALWKVSPSNSSYGRKEMWEIH